MKEDIYRRFEKLQVRAIILEEKLQYSKTVGVVNNFILVKYMKKLFSVMALMVYIFSINTLVHASTMGVFSETNNRMEMWHCHQSSQSTNNKTHSISCCELTVSSEYSTIQIPWEYIEHGSHILPTFNYLDKNAYTIHTQREYVARSPWWNPDIKYQKFSDLFGSIVSLS